MLVHKCLASCGTYVSRTYELKDIWVHAEFCISLDHFFKKDISFVSKCQNNISKGGIRVMRVISAGYDVSYVKTPNNKGLGHLTQLINILSGVRPLRRA